MADQGRAGTKPDQEPGGWSGDRRRSSPSPFAGNQAVPRQLLVRASKGRNQVTPLPHGTSLLEVRAALPPGGEDVVTLDGMRAFSLPAALIACPARFFRLNPVDARTALALVPDASVLLRRLLDGDRGGTVAGRLAAAFRSIGRERVADDVAEAMRAAEPPSTSSAGSGRRSLGIAGAGGRSGQSAGDAEPSPCAVGTVTVSCIHRRGRPRPPTWRMRGLPKWKMDGEHRKTGAGTTMNRRTREETGKGPALGPIGWTDVEWPPGNAVEIHHELLDAGDREGAAKWLANVSVDVLARRDRQRAPVPAAAKG